MKSRLAVALLVVAALSPGVAAGEPCAAEQVSAPSGPGTTMRTAGWLTAGGGGALLSGSLVMFLLADQKHSQIAQGAPSVSPAETNKDMRADIVAGDLLFAAGVVGVATGVSLVLFAPRDETKPRMDVGFGPGRLVLGGSF
jgi:hypothetical protein